MANKTVKLYAKENGGRVLLLFLLFLLAIFQFIHAGFNAFAIICAILITHGLIRTSSLNKQKTVQNEIIISPLGTELIELSVSDQEIFDDVIRTIDVTLKEKCLLCDILITTQSTNPVLYSDNDYINPSTSSARFRIPNNPPQEMTFSYGAAKTPCRIIVSAVINGETDNEFLYISRSLLLGDN